MLIERGDFGWYRERIDCDWLETCCRRAGALHEDCSTFLRWTETIRGQARMLTESTSETTARWTLTKNKWFVAALLVVALTEIRSDAFERRCVRAAEDSVADSIRFDDLIWRRRIRQLGIRRCDPMKLHSVWLLELRETMEILEGFLGLMLAKSSWSQSISKLALLFNLNDDDDSDEGGDAGCRLRFEHRSMEMKARDLRKPNYWLRKPRDVAILITFQFQLNLFNITFGWRWYLWI